MTEDEARRKWCPMARYLATFRNEAGKVEAAGPYNRGAEDSGLQFSRCLASECMWWRWDLGDPYESESKGGILLPRSQWPGHCGAAPLNDHHPSGLSREEAIAGRAAEKQTQASSARSERGRNAVITAEQLKSWIAEIESIRASVLQDAWDLHLAKVLAEMKAAREKMTKGGDNAN